MVRMALGDGMLPEDGNLEEEYRPSALLQNLELKNSAPGSLQHVFSAESLFGILPLESAKSCEISSSAISRPRTRDSRELIPIWELPMNLWIQVKQENMSTKFLKHLSGTILLTKPSQSWQNSMKGDGVPGAKFSCHVATFTNNKST